MAERRTSCDCGYTLAAAPAPNQPGPSASSPPQPGPPPRSKGKQFLVNILIVAVWAALCALAVYFLGLRTSSSRLPDFDTEQLHRTVDGIKQQKATEAERRNQEAIRRYERQTRSLQGVKTERDAETAMKQVDTMILMAAHIQRLQAALPDAKRPEMAKTAEELLSGDAGAANAGEVAEAARSLATELREVAAKYPRAFDAAYKAKVPQPSPALTHPPLSWPPLKRSPPRDTRGP